jgi:NADH-quinone oxidoreductase subunit N
VRFQLYLLSTIFLVTLSHKFYDNQPTKFLIILQSKSFFAGAVSMVSFGNSDLLGLEVLSIALYVLASSNRSSIKSNEAGLKYFLMGSLLLELFYLEYV